MIQILLLEGGDTRFSFQYLIKKIGQQNMGKIEKKGQKRY